MHYPVIILAISGIDSLANGGVADSNKDEVWALADLTWGLLLPIKGVFDSHKPELVK